jgi:hypothetical protein
VDTLKIREILRIVRIKIFKNTAKPLVMANHSMAITIMVRPIPEAVVTKAIIETHGV